jgi:hypothetical protein
MWWFFGINSLQRHLNAHNDGPEEGDEKDGVAQNNLLTKFS